MLGRAALLTIAAGATCFTAVAQTAIHLRHAQYGSEPQVNVGDLLVANEKLGDPNFAETVVLIIQRDADEGTVGLVINRRSEIPLSRVFPDIKGATSDPVFVGGPVSLTAVQALLRLPAQTDDVKHVTGDVYATGSKQVIEKSVRSHTAASKFRLYVGYAGWGAGQLEGEIRLGAWTVLANRSRVIFDDDPDSLWSRLTHESHMQIAVVPFILPLFGYSSDSRPARASSLRSVPSPAAPCCVPATVPSRSIKTYKG